MSFDIVLHYGPALLYGMWVTVQIVGISLAIGGALAFPIALARVSSNRLASGFAYCYIYFFRGTPLLAQTFLIYYGAGQFYQSLESVHLWWFFQEAYYCVILTFALNTSAYQAEILRGALQAVPKGQFETATAFGFSRFAAMRTIILPQAVLLALRPYGNEVILMIKGSAIASVVTVFDLMGATKLAYARSFDFSVYILAAICYLVMVELIRRLWNHFELRLTRHLRPATAGATK